MVRPVGGRHRGGPGLSTAIESQDAQFPLAASRPFGQLHSLLGRSPPSVGPIGPTEIAISNLARSGRPELRAQLDAVGAGWSEEARLHTDLASVYKVTLKSRLQPYVIVGRRLRRGDL